MFIVFLYQFHNASPQIIPQSPCSRKFLEASMLTVVFFILFYFFTF